MKSAQKDSTASVETAEILKFANVNQDIIVQKCRSSRLESNVLQDIFALVLLVPVPYVLKVTTAHQAVVTFRTYGTEKKYVLKVTTAHQELHSRKPAMPHLGLPAHQVRGTRRSGHVTWDSFAKVEVTFPSHVKQLQEITVLQNPTLPLAKRVLQGATA